MRADRLLYTARTHTTGGRDGQSRSSDGRLDIKLNSPGAPGNGTNPEQLFAAGWSACFEGAMARAAQELKIKPPAEVTIDAEIDLNLGEGGFFLKARLNVHVPNVDRDLARQLVDTAHQICPYSKATRGNIEVAINLV